MILQVTNHAEYEQTITLHTGESKTVNSGAALKINTGSDFRLIDYYTSLVGYGFDVSSLQASGNEINMFNDSLNRNLELKKIAEHRKVFQSEEVFPTTVTIEKPMEGSGNPKTLDDGSERVHSPVPKVAAPQSGGTQAPAQPQRTMVLDSKVGEIIPDVSPEIPADFPEDPAAEAEIARLEAQEKAAEDSENQADAKYSALDSLSEDALKKLLKDRYGEETRLKAKWKIINHIIELADDEGTDINELVSEYEDK